MVRSDKLIVAKVGGPVLYEGASFSKGASGCIRFGREHTRDGGGGGKERVVAYNERGRMSWHATPISTLHTAGITPERLAERYVPPSPQERSAEVSSAIRTSAWQSLMVWAADDEWLSWWWPNIREHVSALRFGSGDVLCRSRSGEPVFARASTVQPEWHVYPPSSAGLEQFVEDCIKAGVSWPTANQMSRTWWHRSTPRGGFGKRG
jgi:hypothetical protein